MSRITTGGRRSTAAIAATFASIMIATSACGTDTGASVEAPGPAAAINVPQFHGSADAVERRGAQKGTPMSADTAERMGQSEIPPAPAGKRVPD